MANSKTSQTAQTSATASSVVTDGLDPILIVPDLHGSKQHNAPAELGAQHKVDSLTAGGKQSVEVDSDQPTATQTDKPTTTQAEKTKPVAIVPAGQKAIQKPPASATVKPEAVFTPIPAEAKSTSQSAPLLATAQSKQAVRAIIKADQPKPNSPQVAQPPVQSAAPVAAPAVINPSVPIPQVSQSAATSVTVQSAPQATQTAPPAPAIQNAPAANPAKPNFFNKLFKRKESTPEELAAIEKKKSAVARIHTAEELYKKGLASIKDLIAPSSLEIHYNYLNLSGTFARSFFVYSYPRYLDTNWLTPIINFDATFEFSQFIYPISSEEIMKILRKKVAQIQSSITIDTERGNVRDPALATALEDAEQLRTEIQRGQEKFFQFGMYFTVYAEDEKKLDAVTKQFEGMLGGKLVLTKRADLQGEHAFNSTLPLCLDELEVHRNMNTSPLSTTFPFISSDLTSEDGILYGLNRHNDSLIIFDRFKLPNANACVFASSGAGKSYAVKLEILRMMMLGTDVIVIDPENEYEAITNAVGGSYLRISLNAEQRINPFDLPEPFDDQDTHPGDLLRSNVITISGLLKLMLGQLTDAEDALIEKALLETYAVKGITMDTENPGSIAPPTMEDFHSVLVNLKGAESVAQRLQKYTTGTFAGIFNKPTNVNLDNGLVVFCIRDLEDQLRPIAMYILLNYIWNRVRSKLKKRVLVLDEAWTMMQHEDAAKFLYGLVKRARKYYLGITAITQDVEDFLGSPYGRPVVTNSSLQFLFKQSPSSMEMLQKTFNLTDGEKYLLLNSGVGQGLFFAGRKHVAIQVIASYSEHQLVTTDPEEILAQKAKAAEGFKES